MTSDGLKMMMQRRELLIGAGALALVPIAACAQQRPAARAPGRLIAGETCPVTPRQTEGPFYFDPGLVRQDIREGRPGVPLRLRLQIVDAAECAPSQRARVDVWHCDAAGAYSGYDRRSRDRETFLRGTQFADTNGVAEFETLYPGWYAGRAPHIHVKAWMADGRELTSQIYFPDALSDRLYGEAPYAVRGAGRRLRNGDDAILGALGDRAPIASMTRRAEGYDGAIVIAMA